jgi:uncharacterized metal-binding protein YceD (DUF177 family)
VKARTPSDFEFILDEMPDGQTVQREFDADAVFAESLALDPDEMAVAERIHFRLDLTRVGDVVHGDGEAQVTLNATCVRCLKPITVGQSVPLIVNAIERPAAPKSHRKDGDGHGRDDDDRMELDEEVGLEYHDGVALDLTEGLREQIILELPTHPQCEGGDCQPLTWTDGATVVETRNPFRAYFEAEGGKVDKSGSADKN